MSAKSQATLPGMPEPGQAATIALAMTPFEAIRLLEAVDASLKAGKDHDDCKLVRMRLATLVGVKG